jgi:hypothetical protein
MTRLAHCYILQAHGILKQIQYLTITDRQTTIDYQYGHLYNKFKIPFFNEWSQSFRAPVEVNGLT